MSGAERPSPAPGESPAATAVLLIDDLMFGSRVVAALGVAGIDCRLASRAAEARELAAAADLLIVDLADEALDACELVASMVAAAELAGTRTLGFYAHVHPEARRRGEQAGIEVVVARSRMAREGAKLAADLLAAPARTIAPRGAAAPSAGPRGP